MSSAILIQLATAAFQAFEALMETLKARRQVGEMTADEEAAFDELARRRMAAEPWKISE